MSNPILHGHVPALGMRLARRRMLSVSLTPREVKILRGDATGLQILAAGYPLWITQCGEAEDHMVPSGHRFTVRRPGPVVIQGMRPQRVHAWGDRL